MWYGIGVLIYLLLLAVGWLFIRSASESHKATPTAPDLYLPHTKQSRRLQNH